MSAPRARLRLASPAALVALVLLATACSAKTAPPSSGEPSGGRGPTSGASARPTTSRGTTQGGGGSASPTASSGTHVPESGRRYSDDGSVGSMARAYLRVAPARRLRIQIAYVKGRAPDQAAVDHVVSILRREADKPDGIEVSIGPALAVTSDAYSLDDIAAIERRARSEHSAGSVATMWIVYLNGTFGGDNATLGVAYEGSGLAIFLDQVDSAATTLVQPGAIERSVLAHEIGHLLALVNLGYRSGYDHEDPDHPGHSRYTDSVMYWAIEDISVAALLSGGPPDDFDKYDRGDLEALRRG